MNRIIIIIEFYYYVYKIFKNIVNLESINFLNILSGIWWVIFINVIICFELVYFLIGKYLS